MNFNTLHIIGKGPRILRQKLSQMWNLNWVNPLLFHLQHSLLHLRRKSENILDTPKALGDIPKEYHVLR